ncbi:SFT2D1 [Symbiodinium sp. CCMP2456]|nr:SFT2D1 [Symbiodinium sp. CCMP2456]
MRLYGAWKLLPLLPWARALLSRRAEAGLASLAASEEGEATGKRCLASAREPVAEARQSSDLILEACMQQDQWSFASQPAEGRLHGDVPCTQFAFVEVALQLGCIQTVHSVAVGRHLLLLAIRAMSQSQGRLLRTWDSILFHMEQMGQWGRDMIRHWETPEKTSQLQLWGLALGLVLEFSGMGRGVRAVVGGEKAAERFAILYSVGNLIALMGTFFLAGPMRQIRRMGREHRWAVSLCFLVSMVLTLVVAMLPGNWHGRTLILLILTLIQWASLVWYTLSYIPLGRRTALAAMRSCWRRCMGE